MIDTASGLDEATLAALEYATDLVLLSATDVPSIRARAKEIDALRVIGKPDSSWHFVLNRADARTGLTIAAIETAVGINVDVAIPSSRSVPVSLNQGVPLVRVGPAVAGLAGDARSSSAASRRTTAPADTRPTERRSGQVTPMKLSERMKQSSRRGAEHAPTVRHRRGRARAEAADQAAAQSTDPLTRLKRRAAGGAARSGMGPALFGLARRRRPSSTRTSSASSSAVIKEEKIPLTDAERDQLVAEIIDEVLGLRADRAVPRRPDGHRGHGQRRSTASTSSATASSTRPTRASSPTSTCSASSTASSRRSAGASTSRRRWSTPASPTAPA